MKEEQNIDTSIDLELDPYFLIMNAMIYINTCKYQTRQGVFFDFISTPSIPINEKCKYFNQKLSTKFKIFSISNISIYTCRERTNAKQKDVVSTINNYLRPIKKLCKLNDIFKVRQDNQQSAQRKKIFRENMTINVPTARNY